MFCVFICIVRACFRVLFSTIRTTLGAWGCGGDGRWGVPAITRNINKVQSLLTYPCMVANDVHDITVNISVCGR